MSRDIFSQSNVGVLFTNRTFGDTYNTVAGADLTLRLNDHWQTSGQAVQSWTKDSENGSFTGQAYFGRVIRTGRKFNYEFIYNDFSPQFETLAGFIPRTDYRSVENLTSYHFRPKEMFWLRGGRNLAPFNPGITPGSGWIPDFHPASI